MWNAGKLCITSTCLDTPFHDKKMVENGKENGLPPVSNPNMFHFLQNIQGTIQDLVKQAMTNAKDDEESKSEDSHSQKDGHGKSKNLKYLPPKS